jgi:hypothetical protein
LASTGGFHGSRATQGTVYAVRPAVFDGGQPSNPSSSRTGGAYLRAEPTDAAVPHRERFYDDDYPSSLQLIVDHVVALGMPVFIDVINEGSVAPHRSAPRAGFVAR